MNRETARQEIRSRISCKDFLEKSKNGFYCCPFCPSGHGPNGTGALKLYDTNTWTCFSCHKSGDVIDLYQQANNVGYNEALSLMAQEIGLTIDKPEVYGGKYTSAESTAHRNTARNAPDSPADALNGEKGKITHLDNKSRQKAAESQTEAYADYTAYFEQCRQRLEDPAAIDYLRMRGISYSTAAAYGIGFDPAADPASAPGATGSEYKPHPAPRIIIPTHPGHYIGRSIDPTMQKFQKLNSKDGKPFIFNYPVVYAHDVHEIFVCEGAFDALSVIEAGAAAIALNSTANAGLMIDSLTRRRTDATLILCLDNDKSGKEATETLKTGLQRLNISYITADIAGGYKDPNEALTADRAAFIAAVDQARRLTAAKPDNTALYLDEMMSAEIEHFKKDIKTGFQNLDDKASGLYSGLYVLAAISSLGKTSFALQLADQIAAGGNDVIFFSMEQSRLELVSKSLARRTAQKDLASAVTSLSIRKGYLPRQVLEAVKEYKAEIGDRISIIEGNFECNISFIGEKIRQYIDRNHTRPVVIIDYLQILQPAPDQQRQTIKETVDAAVMSLKRISREHELTVIVISSVNRANYLTPIDFESLKESGGIEYSCDVLWGLQLQCLTEPEFIGKNITDQREQVKEAKAANPRKIQLTCLKNRYGIANYHCNFEYFPAHDLFVEDTDSEEDYSVTVGKQKKAGRRL